MQDYGINDKGIGHYLNYKRRCEQQKTQTDALIQQEIEQRKQTELMQKQLEEQQKLLQEMRNQDDKQKTLSNDR